MSGTELFQIWLMAFVTLALFSFMYKDNPVYRIAEHIFAGLTAGYQVGLIWDTVILQQLWDPMTAGIWNPMAAGKWWLLVPGILGFLMFTRFSQKYSWVSRTSLAFVMGVTAGIFIISQLHGLVLPQMQNTMVAPSDVETKLANKPTNNLGSISFVNPDEIVMETTVDSAVTSDTTMILSETATEADSTAVPAPAKPVVTEVTYPYLLASSANSVAATINPDSIAPVTLTATFVDKRQLSLLEFYAPSFKIRKEGLTTDIELVKSNVLSFNGIDFQQLDDTTYTASYVYQPDRELEHGNYTVGFEVERRSIMLLLAIIIVVGVISTLIYFYFSHEHVGALGVTAKVGIWFIMISFGAHFGYTVMGRVSLLIGRVQFLVQDWVGSFNQLFG